MALKGTIYGTTANKYITAKIEWSATQSTSDNTSTITATLYYCKSSASTAATYGTLTGKIYIGDSSSSYSKVVTLNTNNQYVSIATYQRTINHNNDGSKSIDIYATGVISGTTLSSTTFAAKDRTVTLDTIPRAATINSLSCATSYMNGEITYKYTPTTTSYYVRGNLSLNVNGTLVAITNKNNGKPDTTSQQTKTITLSLEQLKIIYNNLPNATKGTLRLTLYTYSDSGYTNQVGNTTYKEIELTIPTSVKPTVGSLLLTPSTIALVDTQTGATTSSTIGVLVQGKNKLDMLASDVAPGHGSTIAYYIFKAYTSDGTLFSENKVTSTADSQNFVIGPINHSGALKFQVTATDARGRTSAVTEEYVTSHPYTKPSITSFNVSRSIIDSVNYLRYTYATQYSSVNSHNTITVTMYYNNSQIVCENNESSVNVGSKSSITYKVYFTIRDAFGGYAVTTTKTVYGVARAINISADGTGVAFGKMAEQNQLLESRWPISAPCGRFTSNTDASGTSQNDIALRVGDDKALHLDFDSNGIIAKNSATTLGTLALSGSAVQLYTGQELAFRVGADTTSAYVESDVTYDRTYSSASNMCITSNGVFGRTTSSSARYKTDIQNIANDELNPYKILDIPVMQYRYKDEYVPVDKNPEDLYVGLIAEDVAKTYPIAAEYNDDGQVEMWNIKALFPALLKIVQDQQNAIEILKEQTQNVAETNQRIAKLESMVETLLQERKK